MVLGQGLVDADGARHAMTGLLPLMRRASPSAACISAIAPRRCCRTARSGARHAFRGHEFHYASLIEAGSDEPLAELFDADGNALGPSGGRRGLVTGTFFHAIAREEDLAGQQKLAKLA